MNEMVPIVAIVLTIGIPLMIPIIAILTSHQRRMAEILAQSRGQFDQSEMSALRSEVQELKSLVHQQMLTIDTLSSPRSESNESIESRLTTGR